MRRFGPISHETSAPNGFVTRRSSAGLDTRLYTVCNRVVPHQEALLRITRSLASAGAVALLLSGPGRAPVSTIELVWSKALTDMAERFAIQLEPIFRANDESIAVLG